jgi:hypothetical protein
MKPFLAAASLCALVVTGCSTEQVTATCQSAEEVVAGVQQELGVLPVEARALAAVAGIGAKVCGSAQYAAARERVRATVFGFLRQRGVAVDR